MMTGVGTIAGVTVSEPAMTTGISSIESPGLVIGGGVTVTGVPDIVVVNGGGETGRIGVGGGWIVHGI